MVVGRRGEKGAVNRFMIYSLELISLTFIGGYAGVLSGRFK